MLGREHSAVGLYFILQRTDVLMWDTSVFCFKERIYMKTNELKELLFTFRQSELPRLRRLSAYFSGQHRILSEEKASGKPDNRLVNNFCRSITDSTVGYFMGIPVSYGGEDAAALAEAIGICAINDEPFVNGALARDLSVYGRACELFWCDMNGEVRFAPVSPETVFPILSEDVCESLEGAVRIIRRRDGTVLIRYTDHEGVYDFTENGGELEPCGEREHYFGTVPMNFYRNNRDMTGDFEPVLSLVDAYNRLQSESVNDFELFADSYLAISGMGGTTVDDMEKIRRERVLLLDDGGEARWLTKSVNDSYIENLKTRIVKDIYRFSGTADIAETDNGAGITSGVAMKYRLVNFENRVAVTEQFFRRGLMRRWAIISSLYGELGRGLDFGSLRPVFTRNLPDNADAAAELALKLGGVISHRTQLELLPFIKNADRELERLGEEKL